MQIIDRKTNINAIQRYSNKLFSIKVKSCFNMILPKFVKGAIVKGFGRGSKQLGIPTANFPLEVVQQHSDTLDTGIYYGWANINDGDVHKMVMSIGWNPFYENKEKSMETHILHSYDSDLYGQLLKVAIVGFLRPEKNFQSLDELISAIKCDIADAERLLESKVNLELKNSQFFCNDAFTHNEPGNNCS